MGFLRESKNVDESSRDDCIDERISLFYRDLGLGEKNWAHGERGRILYIKGLVLPRGGGGSHLSSWFELKKASTIIVRPAIREGK